MRSASGIPVGLGLSMAGMAPTNMVESAVRAEALGFDSVWSFEAWGSDAYTPLAAIAARTSEIRIGTAIAHIASRSPGVTAMTTLTLQELSDGRFELGLGVSGPQVVEGWHGVPFSRPLLAMREHVAILRAALAADQRLEFVGQIYQVPYRGADATGLGKPLRSTLPGHSETPILIAAIGPQNVALAIDIADGLLPYLWSPTRWERAWGKALARGPDGFRVAPTVFAAVGPDVDACRHAVRPRIAMHVGGMGSRTKNFYKDLIVRYGYEGEAQQIQDLFLAGDRAGATAAVSDALVDDLALIGPIGRIADQLDIWMEGPMTSVIVEPIGSGSMEAVAEVWHR